MQIEKTNPGILNFAPFVEVPAATSPLLSIATIPIVSWLCLSTFMGNHLSILCSNLLYGPQNLLGSGVTSCNKIKTWPYW